MKPLQTAQELEIQIGTLKIALEVTNTQLTATEASAAAMREALQDEQSEIIRGGRHHVEERRMGIIAAALSTDAGKSLLAELQELRRIHNETASSK